MDQNRISYCDHLDSEQINLLGGMACVFSSGQLFSWHGDVKDGYESDPRVKTMPFETENDLKPHWSESRWSHVVPSNRTNRGECDRGRSVTKEQPGVMTRRVSWSRPRFLFRRKTSDSDTTVVGVIPMYELRLPPQAYLRT